MTDGLKSSQRIALYLLRGKSDKVKTIALAGQMIASELYVHGDAAAADAISMLAGPFCNNRPLIHGIGAFGTRAAPTSFAAPRYTSVKRSAFAQDVLYVDTDIVPMVENHDGSAMMPSTFLPLIPLVLLNGVKGIATGWSTSILPRRFEDLQGAVHDVLSRKSVRELMPYYEGRDLTIERDPSTPNKYIVSGQAERKNTSTVIVTELPPTETKESYREKLDALEEEGKIVSFKDRSTDTINIEVKMTRASLGKLTDAKLIELLKLRTTVTENIVVQGIGNTSVVTYDSAEQLVRDWVEWRLGLYLDRYQKLLDDEEQTHLYWQYILACFKHRLPAALPQFSGREMLRKEIAIIGGKEKLPKAGPDILDRISGLPSYKWTVAGKEEAEAELDASAARIVHYTDMVNSDRKRKTQFKREVLAL